MNFYTLASKMNRSITRKTAKLHLQLNTSEYEEDHKSYDEVLDDVRIMEMREFESNATLGIELMMRFKQIATDKGLYNDRTKQCYFIHIRPDEKAINFDAFKVKVLKFLERKCFLSYEASFEQKGLCEENLGKGFHVHMVAHMAQRSKTEVLRDTISTFKDCTSANCIQVDILKTTKDVHNARSYFTNYTSCDDHKEETNKWDTLWRNRHSIDPIYTKGSLPNYQVQSSAEEYDNNSNNDNETHLSITKI